MNPVKLSVETYPRPLQIRLELVSSPLRRVQEPPPLKGWRLWRNGLASLLSARNFLSLEREVGPGQRPLPREEWQTLALSAGRLR